MSDPYSPDTYRDHNGQHSWQSLNNYGQAAAQNGWFNQPQQHNETAREFQIRQDAYNTWSNNGSR